MKITAVSELVTLVTIEGKRLLFKLEVMDEVEVVGRGTHERYMVPEEKFISRAAAKKK